MAKDRVLFNGDKIAADAAETIEPAELTRMEMT